MKVGIVAYILLCVFFLHISPAFSLSAVDRLSVSPTIRVTPVEYPLPYPGLLPDHPLYGIKHIRDTLLIFFTRDPQSKADLYLVFSDKKIGMAQSLWQIGKREKALSILREAEENISSSVSFVRELKEANILPVGMAEKRERALRKHEEIIQSMINQASPQEGHILRDIISITDKAKRNISSILQKR